MASLSPQIRPAAIEADLRRALLLAVVGHRIDAVLDRRLGAAEQAARQSHRPPWTRLEAPPQDDTDDSEESH